MPGFEHYASEANDIEHEIAVIGVALGIDWEDKVAVRTLAREALASHGEDQPPPPPHSTAMVKLKLFGIAQVMLKVMQSSAQDNMHTHGGPTWKAFARGLWAEAESQGLVVERRKAARND